MYFFNKKKNSGGGFSMWGYFNKKKAVDTDKGVTREITIGDMYDQIDELCGFFSSMSDDELSNKYCEAGKIYGEALGYIGLGTCVHMKRKSHLFFMLEREYDVRGFIPVDLNDFISAGYWSKDISHLMNIKRSEEKED